MGCTPYQQKLLPGRPYAFKRADNTICLLREARCGLAAIACARESRTRTISHHTTDQVDADGGRANKCVCSLLGDHREHRVRPSMPCGFCIGRPKGAFPGYFGFYSGFVPSVHSFRSQPLLVFPLSHDPLPGLYSEGYPTAHCSSTDPGRWPSKSRLCAAHASSRGPGRTRRRRSRPWRRPCHRWGCTRWASPCPAAK